jgi:transcriptional regulator with XRE-family HTH domain
MELLILIMSNMTHEEIICRLIAVRKKKGFTQTEMSEKLDISQVQYSNYESGKSDLALKKFLELLKILEIDIADFSDEKNTSKDELLSFIEKQKQVLRNLEDKIKT